jgi:DNA-binding NtrC family response regulator
MAYIIRQLPLHRRLILAQRGHGTVESPLPHGRVLIVDDDAALLEALPETLRLRLPSITVETCSDGFAAIERIEANDYQVIISDLRMPALSGLELLQHAARLRPNTPFILLTGHGDTTVAAQALAMGAYLFVEKPLDREAFVAAVEQATVVYDQRSLLH